jgi:hypothetical protein
MVDNAGLVEQLLENLLKYAHFPPAVLALDELLTFRYKGSKINEQLRMSDNPFSLPS